MSCCVAALFVLGSLAPLGAIAPGVLDSDPEFVPARVIASAQEAPVYPPAALAGRFHGLVELRATVLADGTVGNVEVLWCDHPQLGFEQASVAAVKEWRFRPARRDGEVVESQTTLRLTFRASGVGPGREAYVTAGNQGAGSGVSSGAWLSAGKR